MVVIGDSQDSWDWFVSVSSPYIPSSYSLSNQSEANESPHEDHDDDSSDYNPSTKPNQ